MHGAAVTTMDAWGVPPSTVEDSIRGHCASLDAKVDTNTEAQGTAPKVPGEPTAGTQTEAGSRKAIPVVGDKDSECEARLPIKNSNGAAGREERPTAGGFAAETEAPVTECLVVSGALDRTLCVFRARFGQGLCLLRRLNVACSPRGLPGALIVGFPVEGTNGDVEGNQLEVHGCLGSFRRRCQLGRVLKTQCAEELPPVDGRALQVLRRG